MKSELQPFIDQIKCSDALDYLRQLPSDSVHCMVTSPAYFGLRDYGTAQWEGGDPTCDHQVGRFTSPASAKQTSNHGSGTRQARDVCPHCGARRVDAQVGLEATVDAYVKRLVEILHEAKRVLRPDGSLFLNLGDSFAGAGYSNHRGTGGAKREDGGKQQHTYHTGLVNKNLLLVPFRVALALQASGWVVRSAAPWITTNSMPESVEDRLTLAHEYLFHLVRQERYYFDPAANLKPYDRPLKRWGGNKLVANGASTWDNGTGQDSYRDRDMRPNSNGRNRRTTDVYFDAIDEQIADLQALKAAQVVYDDAEATIASIVCPTEPSTLRHYAMFPTRLIIPCIEAACPLRACPVCGAPYERVVEAEKFDRSHDRLYGGTLGHNPSGKVPNSNTRGMPNGNKHTLGFAPTCACGRDDYEAGIVLDMFMGSGTTALVSHYLGRHYLGCDLNASNVSMAQNRLRQPLEALARDPRQAEQEKQQDDDFDQSPLMRAIRGEE